MALLDKAVVERWAAVALVALREAKRKGLSLHDTLGSMAKMPGWPGRVAWLLLTDPGRLALVLEWLKSGVRPSGALVADVERVLRRANVKG